MIDVLFTISAVLLVFGVIVYLLIAGARDFIREMDKRRDDE